MNTDSTTKIIAASLAAKKWFIETDEFDKKERLLLNFGHTFGHALEGASQFAISHGIAVGLGMLCALALGRGRGLDYTGCADIGALERHVFDLLQAVPSLPATLESLSTDDLFDRFKADKKHSKDSYKVVMPAADGRVKLVALAKTPDNEVAIKNAMATMRDRFLRRAA